MVLVRACGSRWVTVFRVSCQEGRAGLRRISHHGPHHVLHVMAQGKQLPQGVTGLSLCVGRPDTVPALCCSPTRGDRHFSGCLAAARPPQLGCACRAPAFPPPPCGAASSSCQAPGQDTQTPRLLCPDRPAWHTRALGSCPTQASRCCHPLGCVTSTHKRQLIYGSGSEKVFDHHKLLNAAKTKCSPSVSICPPVQIIPQRGCPAAPSPLPASLFLSHNRCKLIKPN